MKQKLLPLLVTGLAAWTIGTWMPAEPADAQEKPAAKADAEKPAAATKPEPGDQTAPKPVRRVPQYFGQVDLTREQREKILAEQDTWNAQISELEKQIAALKEKRDAAVEAVLTAEQKKKLNDLRAAARKKAEESRQKPAEAAPKKAAE